MKVIGAGLGRTGTSSLQAALEELIGGNCYHMKTILLQPAHLQVWHDLATGKTSKINWKRLFECYTASVDFPVCIYYRELMEIFPKAKIILTHRDPELWWNSFIRLQNLVNKARLLSFCVPRLQKVSCFTEKIIIDDFFDGKLEKQNCIKIFERHNASVRATVPKDRLLDYNIKQGWEPLCDFLNVKIPDTPFPHLNSGIEPLQKLFRKTLSRWILRR